MARRIRTSSISLQRFAYGETSQIVHFLTEEHGRLVTMAKGAFREKNGFQGPIDLLVLADIEVRLLEGTELGTLGQRRVVSAYPALRRHPERWRAGERVRNLLIETVPVGEGDAHLYQLAQRALVAAETTPVERLPLLGLSFELHVLRDLGLEPCLEQCLRCGGTGRFSWVIAEGGVVCSQCRTDGGDGVPLDPATWELLMQLSARPLRTVALPDRRTLRSVERAVERHLVYHLERPEPTARTGSPRRRAGRRRGQRGW